MKEICIHIIFSFENTKYMSTRCKGQKKILSQNQLLGLNEIATENNYRG